MSTQTTTRPTWLPSALTSRLRPLIWRGIASSCRFGIRLVRSGFAISLAPSIKAHRPSFLHTALITALPLITWRDGSAMSKILQRRRSLWRLWAISAIWRVRGQCQNRRDRPQPKKSTQSSMRLVPLRMSMFSRSSFPQRRPFTNVYSKNLLNSNTRNPHQSQNLQSHQRTRINTRFLLKNSGSPPNKRAKWVRRQCWTLRLQSRQRRRNVVDCVHDGLYFQRQQDQILGFSPRYFQRQRTAFLILSFLRMLQEHSTFIPFAYSQKGRVWQLGGGVWQQLQRHPQSVLAKVNRKYSAMASTDIPMQMGRYSSICNWYMPKLQLDAREPVRKETSQEILLLAISIHSPTKGQMMRQRVRMVEVREVKSSPRPSIRTELFCNRERVVTYLLKMLMSPSGSSAGTPAQKRMTVMTTKKRSELSLNTSSEYSVISLFILFCRILPSLFSRLDLLAKQHLSSKKKTHTNITSRMRKLVKMGDTLRYQTLVKLGQKEMVLTCRKFLKSEEMTVMKETQLLAVNPNMSPQMRMGTTIELRKMKMVQMAVLAYREEPQEAGRTQSISLLTTSPKRKLVTVAVIITTYWMDCQMYIPVRQSAQAVLMVESVNESIRCALQQQDMMVVLPDAVAVAAVQEEIFSPSQFPECDVMQMLQIPMMQQLTSRKTTITKKAPHPRRNLPQGVIQKCSQFISSGAGTFSLRTRSLFPLKVTLSVGSGTQQQQSVLQQACEHLAYWQCCLNSSRHSFLDFSNWKWTKADWVVGCTFRPIIFSYSYCFSAFSFWTVDQEPLPSTIYSYSSLISSSIQSNFQKSERVFSWFLIRLAQQTGPKLEKKRFTSSSLFQSSVKPQNSMQNFSGLTSVLSSS